METHRTNLSEEKSLKSLVTIRLATTSEVISSDGFVQKNANWVQTLPT
jgi:hypothetical protein